MDGLRGFLKDGIRSALDRHSATRHSHRVGNISERKIDCFVGCSVTWPARASGKDGARRLENKQREQRRHPSLRRDVWDP